MGWLYNQMALESSLYDAWGKVSANDGMPGADGISITDFALSIETKIPLLSELLLTGAYKPHALLKLMVVKPSGRPRTLLIPTVVDRLVQTACTNILSPIIDSELSAATFGFRPGLSRLTAAGEIERLRNKGYQWVLDADIRNFFDRVEHKMLLERLALLIDDEELLMLIEQWLQAEIKDGQSPKTKNTIGLPQGTPIAPLLANLFLDDFDDQIQAEGFKLVRYADDFLILCKSKPRAEAALKLSESLLSQLKLELNFEKTRIISFAEGFKYLGYLFVRSLVIPTKMHPDRWYDKLGRLKLRKLNQKTPLEDEECDFTEDDQFELEVDTGEKIQVSKETLLRTEFGEKLMQACQKQALTIEDFLEKVAKTDERQKQERKETLRQLYSPFLTTLYLQIQGSLVRKEGERFSIEKQGVVQKEIIARHVEQIIVFGNISFTTPAMQFCLQRQIQVTFLSQTGKYFGRLEATTGDNAAAERLQYLRSLDELFALETARHIVMAKIRNARVLLQRRKATAWGSEGPLKGKFEANLALMAKLVQSANKASSLASIRGFEGKAAALFFELYGLLFKKELPFYTPAFRRVRQPPTDPVNSLLSFGYTLLHTNIFSMVRLHGLNPYIGFFHAEDRGNPALVNDLIEEFRWVVDSLVLYTLNKGILKQKDFYYLKEKTGCFLKDEARKRFLEVFEERMAEESQHPLIGAKINLRRQVEVQVKLFKEVLAGKRQKYEPYKFKL